MPTTIEEKEQLRAKLHAKLKQKKAVRSTNDQKHQIVKKLSEEIGLTPDQLEEIKKKIQKKQK